MKWHKVAPDDLPTEDEFVIVSFLLFGKRMAESCAVARLSENYYGDTVGDDGNQYYPIDASDRWAYIELPED